MTRPAELEVKAGIAAVVATMVPMLPAAVRPAGMVAAPTFAAPVFAAMVSALVAITPAMLHLAKRRVRRQR